jgi:AcrR family transcriptional regulator
MSPRTKEQYEKIRESSRTEILNAALELFAKNGFHATSISQIAEKAGISKGLMYNYFKSKDDLLKNIIDNGFQQLNQMMLETGQKSEPCDILKDIIHYSIEHIKTNFTYWQLFMALIIQSGVQKDIEKMMINFRNEAINQLTQIFKVMGKRNPQMEAYTLGTVLDGIGFNMISAPESFPIDEIEEYLIKTYCSPGNKKKRK